MLWIVGKLFPDFRDYLRAHSIPYGIFYDKRQPVQTDGVSSIPLDFSTQAGLNYSWQAIVDKPEVSALLVAGYESYVLPATWLSELLGVPGLTPTAARSVTDKALMRQRFAEFNPGITTHFRKISSWSDLQNFARQQGYPVVLKPTNLMKSLLVSIGHNEAELRRNFTLLQNKLPAVHDKVSLSDSPGIIAEGFLQGSMHTVAGFVDSSGKAQLLPQIADCIPAASIGKQDNYLFSRQLPSQLSVTQQKQLLNVANQGVKTLQLRSTAVHIELMLDGNTAKIIEIGARIGGYRPRMYATSFGINLYQAAIDTAYGRPLKLRPSKETNCAVVELFPKKEGLFVSLEAEDAIRKLPSVSHCAVKVASKELIGPAQMGYRAAAIIFLECNSLQQLEQDKAFIAANDNIKVTVARL